MARTKNKKAQPTAAGPITQNTAGATAVPAPALETDRSLTVPVAKAKTIESSSTEPTSLKIGEVIQGLDEIGKKVHSKLVKFAPDFDEQLRQLSTADDTQLRKLLDEYQAADLELGQGITTILKQRRELFRKNVGLFWEIHECIVTPGYRSDWNGGNERTPDYNFKMWGASTWQEFVKLHSPFGLDQTDSYVKKFGEAHYSSLSPGTTGSTQPSPGTQKNKKKRRQTVIEMANAKLAGEFKSMCKLALNSGVTDGQIAATWKSKAQETYKTLAPAESKALKMPKILEPKQSELETLGIALAKQVWASTLLPADSKEKQAAHNVLLKAGAAAIVAPGLTRPQSDPKLGSALNDQDAERVMVLVAQGNSVEPETLAKYETWLAAKGDTERANALRHELIKWKDAERKKSQKSSASLPNGSPVETSVEPVARINMNSSSGLAVQI